MKKSVLLILLSVVVLCFSPRGFTESPPVDEALPMPSCGSVAIVVADKGWTIEDLNKTAMMYLSGVGEVIKRGPDLNVSVRISPKDNESMCKVVYSQGVGKPAWTVSIGYDGKPLKFTKRRVNER